MIRNRKPNTTRAVVLGAILGFTLVAGTLGRDRAAERQGPPITTPAQLAGKVVHVSDGDTLVLLDEQGFRRVIRLSDIDAPETGHGARRPGQPYSAKSTEYLKSLAHGQQGIANCFDVDVRKRDDGTERDRYVCQVLVGQTDVNLAMIDAGMAMAARQNKRYVRNPATLTHEDTARAARKGLWQQDQPVPPWIWRRDCWGDGS